MDPECMHANDKKSRARRKRKSDKITATNDESSALQLTVNKRRRRAGKLAALIEMSIDVLFEIFGHLKPLDLLKMARLTKQFRSLLMNKSSKSVWKTSLQQVPDLPPCPSDMCEPAWVNLVFDPHCHFCFTNGVRTVEWSLRARICAKCAKEEIMEFSEYLSCFPSPIDEVVLSRPGKRRWCGVLRSEFTETVKQYEALDSEDDRSSFLEKRLAFTSEVSSHAMLCSAWALRQTGDRQTELQRIRDERHDAIIQKLSALGYADEIASIRRPDSLEDHELVKKPQKLTDRIWSNIRKPLIEYMGRMRDKRLVREHGQLVLQRQLIAVAIFRSYKNDHLPHTEVMPEGPDFCDFPPVKAILELPAEASIDESSFSDIIPLIPELIVQWRKDLDAQITKLVKSENDLLKIAKMFYIDEYYLDPDEEEPFLSSNQPPDKEIKLATTVYQCRRCNGGFDMPSFIDPDFEVPELGSPMFYPDVLGHVCLTRQPIPIWVFGRDAEPAKKLDDPRKERHKWTTSPLNVNKKMGGRVKALVLKAGLDPETATANDMDQLDSRFSCVHCISNEVKEIYALTWRGALDHTCTARFHNSEVMWHIKKLDDEELKRAREAYETVVSARDGDPDDDSNKPTEQSHHKVWSCVRCRDTPGEIDPTSLDLIRLHLDEMHEIKNPELNQDYYKSYHSAPFLTEERIVVKRDTPLFDCAVDIVQVIDDRTDSFSLDYL